MAGKVYAGMAVPLEARVELEPWQLTPGTVRLLLLAPDGVCTTLEPIDMVTRGLYRASPILPTPGLWQWQFEAYAGDASRVLEHGRVLVRSTGFSQ